MAFLANGGVELILASLWFGYVMLMAKIEDHRTYRKEHTEKWNWN